MGFNRDVIHRRRDLLNEIGVRIRWAAGAEAVAQRDQRTGVRRAPFCGNSVLTLQFCVNYGGRPRSPPLPPPSLQTWPRESSVRRRSTKGCSPATWTNRISRKSTSSSGHPASSACPTSSSGSPPTPTGLPQHPLGRLQPPRPWHACEIYASATAATAAPSLTPPRPRTPCPGAPRNPLVVRKCQLPLALPRSPLVALPRSPYRPPASPPHNLAFGSPTIQPAGKPIAPLILPTR